MLCTTIQSDIGSIDQKSNWITRKWTTTTWWWKKEKKTKSNAESIEINTNANKETIINSTQQTTEAKEGEEEGERKKN